MKRPSFQFYPGDWQANSNLRRCTHEEKGIWMDIICLLHDQEEYGVVRWSLKELAQAVGAQVSKVRSLVCKGILKGTDASSQCEPYIFTPIGPGRKKGDPVTLIHGQQGPIWYSSRMVFDEYKRVIRGEHGAAPKPTPDNALKPPIGAAPKPPPDYAPSRAGASSSSSSSLTTSEANASDGEPSKITDPDEIIFGYGVPLLVQAGSSDKHARSFLGGLRKTHGDQALIDKLRDCLKAKPLQPLEWLAAALPPKGAHGKTSRHSGFDLIDYRAGVSADGRF